MEISYLNIKNPDKDYCKEIIKKIKARNGYCPSKSEISKDTKCHCKQYRLYGDCECGLFLKIPVVEVGSEDDGGLQKSIV